MLSRDNALTYMLCAMQEGMKVFVLEGTVKKQNPGATPRSHGVTGVVTKSPAYPSTYAPTIALFSLRSLTILTV